MSISGKYSAELLSYCSSGSFRHCSAPSCSALQEAEHLGQKVMRIVAEGIYQVVIVAFWSKA